MDTKKWAMVFGVVFLAIGILGFVPGITANGQLLGIFEVDTMHNIIHIISGIVALVMAGSSASLYFKIFGVIYGLVAIVGFVQNPVLGLIGVNMADNLLHLVIAILALWLGFGMKPGMGRSQSGMSSM